MICTQIICDKVGSKLIFQELWLHASEEKYIALHLVSEDFPAYW